MADEKMKILIQRLLEKTKEGEIRWIETPSMDAFQASFANYSVEIEQEENGTMCLRVYNKDGRVLESITNLEIISSDGDYYHNQEQARSLIDLHNLARRQSLKVNDALEDLLSQLK